MPNWCENNLYVSGPRQDLQNFMSLARVEDSNDDKGSLSLKKIFPRPKGSAEEFLSEYDWRVANWGTKWDLDIWTFSDNGSEIIWSFGSANKPPIDAIRHVSKIFPTLEFKMEFWEYIEDFAGRLTCKNDDGVAELGKPDDFDFSRQNKVPKVPAIKRDTSKAGQSPFSRVPYTKEQRDILKNILTNGGSLEDFEKQIKEFRPGLTHCSVLKQYNKTLNDDGKYKPYDYNLMWALYDKEGLAPVIAYVKQLNPHILEPKKVAVRFVEKRKKEVAAHSKESSTSKGAVAKKYLEIRKAKKVICETKDGSEKEALDNFQKNTEPILKTVNIDDKISVFSITIHGPGVHFSTNVNKETAMYMWQKLGQVCIK
jgi:hypothetical protein